VARVPGFGLDSFGLRLISVAGPCDQGKKPLHPVKCREYLLQLKSESLICLKHLKDKNRIKALIQNVHLVG
jgi:hypothetical protein